MILKIKYLIYENLKTFEEHTSLTVKVDSKTKMKINLDDEILSGKFKNKKIKVKSIKMVNHLIK